MKFPQVQILYCINFTVFGKLMVELKWKRDQPMAEMWLWVTYMLYYLMFIFNKDISIKSNLGGL